MKFLLKNCLFAPLFLAMSLIGPASNELFFPIFLERAEAREQKIDVNQANLYELTKIKGIGNTIAERIITYRETRGLFKKPEDLTRIKGIGGKRFEKIKNGIKV